MCGIVGAFGTNATKKVLQRYKAQRSRGSDGFGFIALREGKLVAFERAMRESEIVPHIEAVDALKPDAILFHHRMPTSTINVPEAAHPLPIGKKGWQHKYYILHNGVIGNADSKHVEIRKAGYKFRSRVAEVRQYRAGDKLYEVEESSEINDSEVLGYYIASFMEGERKDIPCAGAIAAIVVQERKGGRCKVYAMRNYGNPLQVKHKGGKVDTIASEGGGEILKAHTLHRVKRSGELVEVCPLKVGETFAETGYATAYTGMHSDGGIGWQGGYSLGFKSSKPLADVPPRSAGATEAAIADTRENTAIITGEAIRARDAADLAYSDWEEAEGMLKDMSERLSESERIEMEEYAEELRAKWVEREDALSEIEEGTYATSTTRSSTERAAAAIKF